jgi:competence protein ComEC
MIVGQSRVFSCFSCVLACMSKYKFISAILALAALTVLLGIYFLPDGNFHLIACDVGQGDAILAVYKNTQILVDGGPDNKVLDCLGRHMPFWDRDIEAVFLTHPEKDHYMGLIEVFKRYKVDNFFVNGLESSGQEYQVLKSVVGGSGARVINPTTGMVIGNSLMHLDVVYPSEVFLAKNSQPRNSSQVLGAYTSTKSPNDFCIVLILNFGSFNALLTADIGPDVSDEVVERLKKILLLNDKRTIDYIKVPHHGSKNGLTPNLLEITKPKVSVISVGENQLGHPHQEILDMLNKFQVGVARTDMMGDVEVVSDGDVWWLRN